MTESRTRDLTFFAGLLLTAAGLAFIYWPLALLVPGLFLMLLAARGSGA